MATSLCLCAIGHFGKSLLNQSCVVHQSFHVAWFKWASKYHLSQLFVFFVFVMFLFNVASFYLLYYGTWWNTRTDRMTGRGHTNHLRLVVFVLVFQH